MGMTSGRLGQLCRFIKSLSGGGEIKFDDECKVTFQPPAEEEERNAQTHSMSPRMGPHASEEKSKRAKTMPQALLDGEVKSPSLLQLCTHSYNKGESARRGEADSHAQDSAQHGHSTGTARATHLHNRGTVRAARLQSTGAARINIYNNRSQPVRAFATF